MFYDRKIRYLDYLVNGERFGGTGFAKLEVRDETFRIEATIKGIKETTGIFPILLLSGDTEKKIGEIILQKDGGVFRYTYPIAEGIGETGIPYEELEGIRIRLGENREAVCRWSAVPQRTENMRAQPLKIQESAEQSVEEPMLLEKKQPEESQSVEKETSSQMKAESDVETGQEKMIRLQEDKWTQLCTIYPHIRPFRDEREYLSISPADFVLLPAADYRAAHNSFLLHGYYNYHHLILTRVERRGEIIYYLGVPGNYFEKEKQVAVMFGFESFECADEPADYGDFGYYMMRTNI